MRRDWPYFPLLFLVLLAVPASAQPVGIQWQQDIESAKTLARDTGRLVLLHFWTPSCGPCMMLNQNVFNQPGVGTAVEAQFVPVKLDANENSATAVGFGITRVPTDVVITPEGEVVGQFISPPTPSAYIAELSSLAAKHATRHGQSFAKAAAAAPFGPPQRMNDAYANLPLGNQVAPAIPPMNSIAPANQLGVGTPAAVAAQPAATFAPAIGSASGYAAQQPPQIGRYASLPAAGQAPALYAAGTVPVTPTASQGFGPAAMPPQPATDPPLAPPAIVPPAIVANRYADAPQADAATSVAPTGAQLTNPYVAGPVQSGTAASASQPSTAAPAAGPDPRRLRPGAPPLGFEGYCPVSMRNHWKWVPGNPDYGIIHRGRTYWFAGPEEQQQFWANPDHFSPALSGLDPVLAVDHKQQVPGKREHSLDYDNLFYLFSSEATLQQFAANPERYAATVRQAMGIQRGRFVR